jgi:hypothetical protein
MNRAFSAGGLALHESSPRRAAYERRAFGAKQMLAHPQVIEIRRYEPVVPMRGAIGGLDGPAQMGV